MKNKMILTLLASLLVSFPVVAGQISDVFSDTIFDLKWFSTLDEVQQQFPGGQAKSEGGLTSYRIHDGRTVLSVERNESNYIDFWFNSEKQLNFVAVQFPSVGPGSISNLLSKLTSYFGPQSDNAKAIGNTLIIRWPEDNGFMINLTNIDKVFGEDELVFGVANTKPATANKKKLGF
jgi:hypothetical protein